MCGMCVGCVVCEVLVWRRCVPAVCGGVRVCVVRVGCVWGVGRGWGAGDTYKEGLSTQ